MGTKRMILGTVVLMALVGTARASPVTWEFAGEVRNFVDVFDRLGGSVTVGTPFSGSFTFDTSTPDSLPDDPTYGIYEGALTSLSGVVGDVPFASNGLIDITVLNDFGPTVTQDRFVFEGSAIILDRIVTASFGLTDASAGILLSDALPIEPPPLDKLLFRNFGISSQEEGIFIDGEINYIVPEPGTLCLLGLGTVILARTRRRVARSIVGRVHRPDKTSAGRFHGTGSADPTYRLRWLLRQAGFQPRVSSASTCSDNTTSRRMSVGDGHALMPSKTENQPCEV